MKRYWALKWANYLEQKGLRQARGRLFAVSKGKPTNNTPKCCLGHAEFMVGSKPVRSTEDIDWHDERSQEWGVKTDSGYYDVSLTPETKEKMGMYSGDGSLRTGEGLVVKGAHFNSLAGVNDAGVSLKEIAKLIRQHWKDL